MFESKKVTSVLPFARDLERQCGLSLDASLTESRSAQRSLRPHQRRARRHMLTPREHCWRRLLLEDTAEQRQLRTEGECKQQCEALREADELRYYLGLS